MRTGAVVVAGDGTQSRGWRWRSLHAVDVDATVSVGQRVVGDVPTASEDVHPRGGGVSDARDVVVVDLEVVHSVQVERIFTAVHHVVLNQDVLGVPGVDGHSVTAGVQLVVGDVNALSFVAGVNPNVGNLAAVFEHVVRHGQVVNTDFAAAVGVVVGGPLSEHTNTTVDERVAVNDVAVATVHDETHVVHVNGVVQFGVTLVVDQGTVGDLEVIQSVVVVVSVAHGTDQRCDTAHGGVVDFHVHGVVAVPDGVPLWVTAARKGH